MMDIELILTNQFMSRDIDIFTRKTPADYRTFVIIVMSQLYSLQPTPGQTVVNRQN